MVRDNMTEEGTFQNLKGNTQQNLDPSNLYKFNLQNEENVILTISDVQITFSAQENDDRA